MSVLAQMEGLPTGSDTSAVIITVRKILHKHKIRFWVNEFESSEEENGNKCKIKFFSKQDATKAIARITSKPQIIMGLPCEMKVRIIAENIEENKNNSQVNRRDRSRSPISKEEANIDKELEQLKKEKEELEKRKSELLQKKMSIDQKQTKTEDKDAQKETPKPPIKMNHQILPKCPPAENTIIEEMKSLIKPHVQKRYYQIFMQRLRVEVRIKVAIVMETSGLRLTPISQIVKAYRAKFPKHKDAELIESVRLQVKLSFWAYKGKSKDGVITEPFDYDESDEENAAVEGVPKKVVSKDDNKMEIVQNYATCITEDTTEDADEADDGIEMGDNEVEYDEVEGAYEIEDDDEVEAANDAECDAAEVGNEIEGDEAYVESGNNEEGNKVEESFADDVDFEGGTGWNDEEADKVPPNAAT